MNLKKHNTVYKKIYDVLDIYFIFSNFAADKKGKHFPTMFLNSIYYEKQFNFNSVTPLPFCYLFATFGKTGRHVRYVYLCKRRIAVCQRGYSLRVQSYGKDKRRYLFEGWRS